MSRVRLHPQDRRQQILNTAVAVAHAVGYARLSMRTISESIGISRTLIAHYYSMRQIRDHVMQDAINRGDIGMIAQGLGVQDPVARRAPLRLREDASRILGGLRGVGISSGPSSR